MKLILSWIQMKPEQIKKPQAGTLIQKCDFAFIKRVTCDNPIIDHVGSTSLVEVAVEF